MVEQIWFEQDERYSYSMATLRVAITKILSNSNTYQVQVLSQRSKFKYDTTSKSIKVYIKIMPIVHDLYLIVVTCKFCKHVVVDVSDAGPSVCINLPIILHLRLYNWRMTITKSLFSMCGSRKYPYPPLGGQGCWKFQREGVSKAQIFKGKFKYEPKPDFPERLRGVTTPPKKTLGRGMNIFCDYNTLRLIYHDRIG